MLPQASLAAILAMGKPVALEAKAEERLARGGGQGQAGQNHPAPTAPFAVWPNPATNQLKCHFCHLSALALFPLSALRT